MIAIYRIIRMYVCTRWGNSKAHNNISFLIKDISDENSHIVVSWSQVKLIGIEWPVTLHSRSIVNTTELQEDPVAAGACDNALQ